MQKSIHDLEKQRNIFKYQLEADGFNYELPLIL